ncbi:helix-turn-helix domain-containing protein [Microbacterium sp. P04]|uniref:helix-turn-helix domain-containing protein n=1 Tax=Microbacterium sp. P04 TaxID=3366947 RepID=UPI003745C8FF
MGVESRPPRPWGSSGTVTGGPGTPERHPLTRGEPDPDSDKGLLVSTRSVALAHFLKSRRAQLTPASVGLPELGPRRVPGLRREEVAGLAGISSEYYIRIERGRDIQMSDQVLANLARALELDKDELRYFYRLATPAPQPVRRDHAPVPISEDLRALIGQYVGAPAYVFDSNQDIVAINEMADLMIPSLQLYGDNLVIANFEVVRLFPHDAAAVEGARLSLAALRFHGDPENARLREIVGALSVESPVFRRLWAEHPTGGFTNGTVLNNFDGEVVPVPWQVLDVPGGFFMVVMPTQEGTRAHELITRIRDTKLTGRPLRGPLTGWPTR